MNAIEQHGPGSGIACLCGAEGQPLTSRGHLPHGWKRIAGTVVCSSCLHARYLFRSVVVPIAGPCQGTWDELATALHGQWQETTRCANWIITTLYARDTRRAPSETKLGAMPRLYLYPEARGLFPAIVPVNLATLLQQVERTYRRQRYELLWTAQRTLATHRYPTPLPLHPTSWRLEETAGGAILAHVRADSAWRIMRLRMGAEFHKQRAQIRALLSGVALGQTGAIYRQAARPADHRDRHGRSRVLLKLTGWFPRPPLHDVSGVLELRTEASDLLVGRIHGRGIVITIHGDLMRRGICAYRVRLGRLQETLSVARRFVQAERIALERERNEMVIRQRRAIKTHCQQIAATVAGVARRERVATVQYEDEIDLFCRPFPWHLLRETVRQAVEGVGVAWEYPSGLTGRATADPLVEDVTDGVST